MNNLHVLRRSELRKDVINTPFPDIQQYHNPGSQESIRQADMVAFIDEDGSTKILKNRWGNPGVVISESQYKHYIELLKKEIAEAKLELEKLKNENNQSNNTPKKKHFMGGIFKFNFWPFNRS